MADALVSPAVGGTMWVVSGGLIACCARKTRETVREDLVPLMGVLGAFIFAAQMINFSIPGTGSSGHLAGGLILAILLGPPAAFLVIASVLTVQALFFADGGLLALGCNIFNMGFWPAFVAYPLLYRPLAGERRTGARAWPAAIAAAVVALQLGAFGVVVETTAAGISELKFRTFLLLMQPIHLAIGVVEGIATAAVVAFVARARPVVVSQESAAVGRYGSRAAIVGLLVAAVVVGGIGSWFASSYPDGLEWSIGKVTGSGDLVGASGGVHRNLESLQEKTALLPDYGFKVAEGAGQAGAEEDEAKPAWPAVDAGTSVSGLLGGALTLGLAALIGLALRGRRVIQPPA